jgi:exopolysaccharide biosynthesis WecB/TagA/CpsF family protein
MDSAIRASMDRARNRIGFTFFTLNLDHLCKRRQFDAFRGCYDRATLVSADGSPIVWLARSVRAPISRTTGADLVRPLIAEAASSGISVYFFGTSDDVLTKTIAKLTKEFPNLVVAGYESPKMGFNPTSEEAEEAADRIAASGAGFCFVALGAPKQELFADMAFDRCGRIGFFCVGAALDFIAGHQIRAPEFMARNGLEWLWRLLKNPIRLFTRYFDSAMMLLWLSLPWQFELVLNARRPHLDHAQPRTSFNNRTPLVQRAAIVEQSTKVH